MDGAPAGANGNIPDTEGKGASRKSLPKPSASGALSRAVFRPGHPPISDEHTRFDRAPELRNIHLRGESGHVVFFRVSHYFSYRISSGLQVECHFSIHPRFQK